jgi:hypothetical protein
MTLASFAGLRSGNRARVRAYARAPGKARRLACATLTAMVVLASTCTAGITGASTQTVPLSPTNNTPPDLINLSALELPATVPPPNKICRTYSLSCDTVYYPGGIYSATPAQIASLEVLESQAVGNTVTDHSLNPDDQGVVLSWDRSEAQAELWELVVQAIQAVQSDTADPDQKNVVDWLTAVTQREEILSAQGAGLEYTKWAGLGISAWNTLLASNPSESALQNFLSLVPQPYSDGGLGPLDLSRDKDGGYCVFHAPSPYQSDYTAYVGGSTAFQECFTPCTDLTGCNLPYPTYKDFEEWGDAEVEDSLFDNPGYTTQVQSIATDASMAVATVGAVGAGFATAFALNGALVGSAFQTTVLPFAERAVFQARPAVDVESTEATGEDLEESVDEVADTADEIGADAASTGVGVIVAAVIFAVLTAIQEGLIVVSAEQLPGQLAQLVHSASTNRPDLTSMLGNSDEMQGLFGLFVGSSMPTPIFNSCNNTGITPVSDSTSAQAARPCLNATPVPAESRFDPQWIITPKGSSTTSAQSAISWKDSANGLTTSTYLDGSWFVDTTNISGIQVTTQSLSMQYTDWQGNEETSWLFSQDNPPKFITVPDSDMGSGFSSSTCLTAHTCSLSTAINFVAGNGHDYSAAVTPGGIEVAALELCSQDDNAPGCVSALQSTSTAMSASPATAIVNQPVTLTATVNGGLLEGLGEGTAEFAKEGLRGRGSSPYCPAAPVQYGPVHTGGSTTSSGITITNYSFIDAANCTITFSAPGTYTILGTFSGDAAGDQPSQGGLTLTVLSQPPRSPTTPTTSPTSTTQPTPTTEPTTTTTQPSGPN